MAGYSTRSLADKPGIKPGQRICLINSPEHYRELLGGLPGAEVVEQPDGLLLDLIQIFTDSQAVLRRELPRLRRLLAKTAMLWVSWPKKMSGLPSDLRENVIRDIGLATLLVDVKVAAVDETWSGLKFVFAARTAGDNCFTTTSRMTGSLSLSQPIRTSGRKPGLRRHS